MCLLMRNAILEALSDKEWIIRKWNEKFDKISGIYELKLLI